MTTGPLHRQAGLALVLTFAAFAAGAQGGITPPPDKTRGATSTPASGVVPTVAGPSTISVAPKKSNKAPKPAKKAKAAKGASAASS